MTERSSGVIDVLTDVLEDRGPSITVYLFGSILRSSSEPSDIDVLLIYPNGMIEEATGLAETLESLTSSPPIEVLALSESEAKETNFVASEEARIIWSPPKSDQTTLSAR